MEKSPVYLKIIGVLGTLSALLGLYMAIKIPGNIALAPLFFGLILGLFAFLVAKNKKIRSISSLTALGLAIVGIIVSMVVQATSEPTVAVDKTQEQVIEQRDSAITSGDELDNALDELDDLDDSTN